MLEVRNLVAGYGDAIVLENLSFTLPARAGLAVLGRNGVGKTTLLLSLVGQTRRSAGSILWDGADITDMAPHLRARCGIGWVPQERNIFPSLSVEENLRVAAAPGRFDLDAVYGLFPRLRERHDNMGDGLSGGEQQMLAIGRTLMTNPRLLLLDEPFEGLAPVIVEELEATLMRLRQQEKLTTVIVEQRAEDALRLSDHAIVLERGRIVEAAPSAELLDDLDRVQRWIAV